VQTINSGLKVLLVDCASLVKWASLLQPLFRLARLAYQECELVVSRGYCFQVSALVTFTRKWQRMSFECSRLFVFCLFFLGGGEIDKACVTRILALKLYLLIIIVHGKFDQPYSL
jgi:hypothetical protein